MVLCFSYFKTKITLFKTEKPDHANHGIGLQSVRYYVEKNNGLIDFFEENGFFGVHIIVNLS